MKRDNYLLIVVSIVYFAFVLFVLFYQDSRIVSVYKAVNELKIVGVKDITFNGQSTLDLYSHIKVSDANNEALSVKVEGAYDLTKNGIYNLMYAVCDSSGNKTVAPFKLIVNLPVSSPKNKVSYQTITAQGYKLILDEGVAYIDDNILVNKTYSIPKDYKIDDLVQISSKCSLRKIAYKPFKLLASDAAAIGLNIYASTCYRSYAFQNILYSNYVKRDGIEAAEKYSARPGYSEHQTGLSVDVNTVNNAFSYTLESKWLNDNCHRYGFIIRYPQNKENITGYQYEPWHLRYVGNELAKVLYNNGNWLTIEEYFGITSNYSQ